MGVRYQVGIPWLARGWPDPPKPVATIRHAFPLRPGALHSRAYIELPEDLTEEAERMSAFIRSVSFKQA